MTPEAPTHEIVGVDHLECRVVQRPWPFALERAGEIDAHWAQLRAAKPAIFNGRVLLQHAGHVAQTPNGRVFVGEYLETEFKAFIAWRDFGRPAAGVRNCFAMAALRSADGAFIIGEMAAHTANAGRCYFPAGTPDPSDVRDGMLDLDGSARRELREETGLDPAALRFDPAWHLVLETSAVACMKPVRSPDATEAVVARIEAFLRTEAHPELARIHAVRCMADTDGLDMPIFMRPYLAWAFA